MTDDNDASVDNSGSAQFVPLFVLLLAGIILFCVLYSPITGPPVIRFLRRLCPSWLCPRRSAPPSRPPTPFSFWSDLAPYAPRRPPPAHIVDLRTYPSYSSFLSMAEEDDATMVNVPLVTQSQTGVASVPLHDIREVENAEDGAMDPMHDYREIENAEDDTVMDIILPDPVNGWRPTKRSM